VLVDFGLYGIGCTALLFCILPEGVLKYREKTVFY
jgi:hypothetical protein